MSPPDGHRDEERLFGEAVSLPAPDRAAFLAHTCAQDVTLLRRVTELLKEHDQSTNALDRPPALELHEGPEAGAASRSERENVASSSGHYLLGGKLGEGGWGIVYAAEQIHPVRRSVAVKIIKPGMDTHSVVVRFQAERQALAMMDHESIARVYDAGETASGRPFFVMERVSGARITHYCDEHKLTIEERLELFMQVCDAVQHAHQKGVIHRDLKPSNILVAPVAGGVRPKIIDFGIAKATQGRLGDETVVTEVDSFVGTPAYMSPEQADRRDDAIDTRSDLYSLGVVLYELLTGCTPLDVTEVRTKGIEEVRRRIREVDPVPPSLRVSRLTAEVGFRTAAERGLGPPRLPARIAGDLDRVVMKCLEKQPARRYEAASALAQDIRRHLDHEPVSASPAGQWYLLRKFVRRNRVAFGIAGGVAALLVIGITLSTVLLFREKAALARAVAAEHEQARARGEAEEAGQQARKEATRSTRATQFMTSVFNSVKPAVARGRDPELLREVLDDAAARLESALKDEPEVEAELSDVIGGAFWHINEPHKAARLHRRALDLHEQTLGPMHQKVASTLMRLGLFEMYHGRQTEAERNFRRVIDIRSREFGPEAPHTLDGKFSLAESLGRQKRYPEALELLEQVHKAQMRIFPSDDLRLLRTVFIWASFLQSDGAFTAAERMYRRVIANYPSDTKEQSLALFRFQAMEALSVVLLELGRLDEAIELSREAFTHASAQGADSGPAAALLAQLLHRRGRCDETLTLTRATAENFRQRVRRDPSRLFVLYLLDATMLHGDCLAHAGRLREAEPWFREACSLSLQPGVPLSHHSALSLANVLREQGKADDADTVLEDALRQAAREHNGFVFQLLPAVYRSRRFSPEADGAKAFLQEYLAGEAAWVEQSGTAAVPYSLSLLCAAADLGAFELIAPIVRERLDWWRRHRPQEAPAYAYGVLAGEVLLAEGRQDEAERALLVASAGLERTKDYWDYGTLWRDGRLDGALARFYAACTLPEEPGRWRQRVGSGTFDLTWELRLAGALVAAGRYREAGDVLPGAMTRAREILAKKPDHDRWVALGSKADALWKECQAKLASNPPAQSLVHEGNK